MIMMTLTARKHVAAARSSGARGFTLLEMMVVIGLVSMMVAMSLPSVVALFNAGADAQAYNLITAQLTAARAQAVVGNTYSGIHVQLADAPLIETDSAQSPTLLRPKLAGVCFSGMLEYDPNTGAKSFDLVTAPVRVPGAVVFGYASQAVTPPINVGGQSNVGSLEATLGNSSDSPFTGDAGTLRKFTTFSVIFNSAGAVTRFVDGGPVRLNPESRAFSDSAVPPADLVLYDSQRLWRLANTDYVQDRYGVTAMTMFNIAEYESADKPLEYLNENAQVLPMNVHTGQLYKRN